MCSIHVTDPASAHEFYTGKLGFETLVAMPEGMLFVVNAPGQDVGLLLEPSDPEIAEPYRAAAYERGLPAIVFGSDDLDADIARLREAGVSVVGDVMTDPSGRSVLIDDEHGNYVQLHESVS